MRCGRHCYRQTRESSVCRFTTYLIADHKATCCRPAKYFCASKLCLWGFQVSMVSFFSLPRECTDCSSMVCSLSVIMSTMTTQRECIACLKPSPLDGIVAACSKCQHAYYTGKCSGVTKNALMALSPVSLSAWKYSTCTLHATRQLTMVDDQLTADERSPA